MASSFFNYVSDFARRKDEHLNDENEYIVRIIKDCIRMSCLRMDTRYSTSLNESDAKLVADYFTNSGFTVNVGDVITSPNSYKYVKITIHW